MLYRIKNRGINKKIIHLKDFLKILFLKITVGHIGLYGATHNHDKLYLDTELGQTCCYGFTTFSTQNVLLQSFYDKYEE